ncbi:MAG: hypothetical protein IPP66_16775 [Anaerolineales bacterium]|nr:hypothetical protein [Anaerolineales bacterium]
MTELRRLGEVVDFESEFVVGDKRIIRGLDNLGGTILFPDERHVIKDFYMTTTNKKKVYISDGLGEIEIGDYEGSILDKLLKPIDPVLCIKGRMGSGKTTTMKYIMENFMDRVVCECQGFDYPPKRLTAWVDFKELITEIKATVPDLIDKICTQLWNKCVYYLDDDFEYRQFWDHLLQINEFGSDSFVEQVVGNIHSEYPDVRKVKVFSEKEISNRKIIKAKLKDKSVIWYLRYLILLYRFIIQVRFSNHRECAIIILDNVDSLSTELQRSLVKIIIGCAHYHGPLFVILVRPETFERHGLNDILRDIIVHQSPDPHQVIISRLERFLNEPDAYFKAAQTLTDEEKRLATSYLRKIYPKLKNGSAFREFIISVSGKSIRNSLVLAQSIFQLTAGEMKRRDLTVHYLIRAIVRFGYPQFRGYQNPRVVNPFDVEGVTDGRYLTKVRLLKYIAGRGGACHTPTILSTFAPFNTLNLAPNHDVTAKALEELLSNDCQLLTSNGYDAFHITPENDQDEISITEIGRGYIDHLIHNIHFIQEVMLDARVESDFRVPGQHTDKLAEKLSVMIRFLDKVHLSDVAEVQAFNEKGIVSYAKVFQPHLISFEIIQSVYEHTKRLIVSIEQNALKNIVEEYEDVLDEFQELLYKAKANNNRLFGVTYGTRPEPE